MCSKVNSTDTTVNNVNRTCPTTVLNTSTTLTRVTDDSSSYTQGDFELDTSVNSELGESTPIAFAPPDPTQQDLEWPQLLVECRLWLISAVRETNTCAQSTPSLPPSTTENIPIARLCMDKRQTGSHTSSPANRDVTPTTTMWIPTDHHHHMSGLVIPTTLVAITAQVTRRCPQHLTRHRQTKSCQHPPEGTPTGSHRQPQS